MGRCKGYWYEVTKSFKRKEEAYHRRRRGIHDRSVIYDGHIFYELCGNDIAEMPLEGKMLYIRTAGWYTQTTASRLRRIVPYPLGILFRSPRRGFTCIYLIDSQGRYYLVPPNDYIGIDLIEKRVTGIHDCYELAWKGKPERVIPYIRKPRTEAEQYYRIEYRDDGSVDKVLVVNGDKMILVVPDEGFVGTRLTDDERTADFIESKDAYDELIKILRDDHFSRVADAISHMIVLM